MKGLRWTVAVTALLLLAPGALLLSWPRPRAQGLARLLGQASLLQSFPAAPERPVPALWTERLGEAQARRIWTRQSRVWWQFWGRDGDGGPFLAFPAPPGVVTALPPQGLRVDDLVVVAPDPLSQRLLQDQLKLSQRPQRGLEQRCLERLQQQQAVFWSPLGLGLIAGPMAPLLQRFQEGCLSLRLQAGSLDLSGEAAASAGILASPGSASAAAAAQPVPAPLPANLLLEWRGPALEVVLQGLLSRQLVREPLAARYGIGEGQLALLRRAPFVLQLRPLPKGPYQAGLALQLAVAGDRQPWNRLLAGLQPALEGHGLQLKPSGSAALPAVSWHREDGTEVGGWRWLGAPGPAADPQLLVYLGPQPNPVAAPKTAHDQLRVRPGALEALGLLPPSLPLPVRQAGQLSLVAIPLGSSVSQLSGRLQLQAR